MLADLDRVGLLPGRVRLIFQPAEELMPGGALDVVTHGGLDGVERAYALHCDPHTDVGFVGSRVGAITAAADRITVRLTEHGHARVAYPRCRPGTDQAARAGDRGRRPGDVSGWMANFVDAVAIARIWAPTS